MIWNFIRTNVDIIVGIIMAFFTTSIAYFAYRQHRLEKTRLKLEAYDRRLRIYNALNDFIINLEIGTFSQQKDARRSLIENTRYVGFLFKKHDGIDALLNKFLIKGSEVMNTQEKLDSSSLHDEEKERMISEKEQLMRWFRSQDRVIYSKFSKYLQLL